MSAQSRKILECPSDLVKWVVGIALHAMNANPYCCKTLSKAVAVIRGKRFAWTRKEAI